jgi:hypothetical protein
METVRQHLKKLPLQKRLQAMENTRRTFCLFEDRLDRLESGNNMLSGLFTFNETKQGHDYWWDINTKYYR